jgi:formate dehydrogenase subunit beta
MAKAIKISKGVDQGLRDFFESLFNKEKIKGVFALKKMNENGAVSSSLITNGEELKNAVPLAPYMPVNAGKVLSDFSLEGTAQEPVAAVLRPCELSAFVELIKRTQGNLDNILLISLTCGGVLPLKFIKEKKNEKSQSSYWEAVKNAEISPDIRATCKICENFIPQNADMVIASVGKKDLDTECTIYLTSKKGEDYAKQAGGSAFSEAIETEKVEKLKKKREEQKTKYLEDFEKEHMGREALVKTFASCLGCHGCSHACPICYCTLCDFDSKTIEYQPLNVKQELEQKGGLKVPPGNIFFHLGRMTHMAVSCVSCGMCSDVCPVDIPVASIFSVVGTSLQEVLNYIPGKDVEEPVPSGSYKEQEFVEVGEQ